MRILGVDLGRKRIGLAVTDEAGAIAFPAGILDSRGRITAMHAMPKAPPRRSDQSVLDYEQRLPRYSSRRFAQFAIELAPGWLEKLDFKVGQRLELDYQYFRTVARERRLRRPRHDEPRRP